jgi:hypothetical protein
MRCEYADIRLLLGTNKLKPTHSNGRKDEMMQDTQVTERSEIQSNQDSASVSETKSSFDNVEYERWSQTLRSRNGAKK